MSDGRCSGWGAEGRRTILDLPAFILLLGITGCGTSTSSNREPEGVAQPPPQTSAQEQRQEQTAAEHATPTAQSTSAQSTSAQSPAISPETIPSGKELFARHCAACHGEAGDGRGLAAPFLFPRPRDIRSGKFRLVSTNNNVPTREDLDAVLVRGMPGSSMPPWAHFGVDERGRLIDEVLRLYHEGMRDQYVTSLKDAEGLTDDEIAEDPDLQEEIAAFVERRTTPGSGSEVPEIAEADARAVARGKEIYLAQSCHSCHGNEGRGDGALVQLDDDGLPTRPRDYTRGIFKGGHDLVSLYRRIAYGMPGTPMPGSRQLTPEQLADMVHFIRSLSNEQQRQSSILKRRRLTAERVERLGTAGGDVAWSRIPAVDVQLTPLWWRDDFADTLQVQAAHDGKSIALRLSWTDATKDDDASRSESFEDALAVELYAGDASAPEAPENNEGPRSNYLKEPFLGMGDANTPIDIWYWDADRQNAADVVKDTYPETVVDIYPFSEQAVATAEFNREGTQAQRQPDVALPAVASGNPIVPPANGNAASSLSAGGLGSVSFRPPRNQAVEAHGDWSEGRWTVVMLRPLAMSDSGVALEPGATVSSAFAVWDGSHGDRDGKKLITIWQDLTLEH